MNEPDVPKDLAEQALDESQVEQVAGGDGDCGVTVGTGGISISGPSNGIGQEIIQTYEGIVAATSHIIERVLDGTN